MTTRQRGTFNYKDNRCSKVASLPFSLCNLICCLLIKCVSALHSTWQVFEQKWTKFSDAAAVRLCALECLLLCKVYPCPCSVGSLKNTNTSHGARAPCSQKITFCKSNLFLNQTHPSCDSCPMQWLSLRHLWHHSRGRNTFEQGETRCRCQEPIHSTSPSVRHGYLFTVLFLLAFICASYNNNFPCELAAGIDQVRDCLYALHSSSLRAVWLSR